MQATALPQTTSMASSKVFGFKVLQCTLKTRRGSTGAPSSKPIKRLGYIAFEKALICSQIRQALDKGLLRSQVELCGNPVDSATCMLLQAAGLHHFPQGNHHQQDSGKASTMDCGLRTLHAQSYAPISPDCSNRSAESQGSNLISTPLRGQPASKPQDAWGAPKYLKEAAYRAAQAKRC